MPVMQQPEAYLSHVTDDKFDADGCLRDGPLKELVLNLATAFVDWVDLIVRSRRLLAEDAAHAEKDKKYALLRSGSPGANGRGERVRPSGPRPPTQIVSQNRKNSVRGK